MGQDGAARPPLRRPFRCARDDPTRPRAAPEPLAYHAPADGSGQAVGDPAFHPSPSALCSMTGWSHASGRAGFPVVCGLPCVRFHGVVRFWPPSPLPHSGGAVGETCLRRNVPPARNAMLRLVHERPTLSGRRTTTNLWLCQRRVHRRCPARPLQRGSRRRNPGWGSTLRFCPPYCTQNTARF